MVEKLADKQEQMARDIAALQATEQNLSQKISSLPQAPASGVLPRKNEPKVVHSKANVQPAVSAPPCASSCRWKTFALTLTS